MRTTRARRRRSRSGFTLIETLIVVMYIAILAGIVVPRVSGVGRQATEANLRATIRELRGAVASYQAETGLYPMQLADIIERDPPATGLTEGGIEVPIYEADFRGPYLLAAGGRLPMDRATGQREWDYNTSPPRVGHVKSLSTTVGSDGTPYNEY